MVVSHNNLVSFPKVFLPTFSIARIFFSEHRHA
jgi:hypothetical protein